MTYEEREKQLCRECSMKETCPYIPRKMEYKCQNISDTMYGWELGYRDAVDKACEWLRRTQPKSTLPDTTIERFRKVMEG